MFLSLLKRKASLIRDTIICGFKDRYVEWSLELCWLKNMAVVGSPPASMTSSATGSWQSLRYQPSHAFSPIEWALCPIRCFFDYFQNITATVAPLGMSSCGGHYCGFRTLNCFSGQFQLNFSKSYAFSNRVLPVVKQGQQPISSLGVSWIPLANN